MAGLCDDPRPGTPRKITDTQVEEAVTQTLESLPPAATHWSTRSLAEKVGLSQSSVVRIWHTFGLQLHRSETFKLSTDPLLVEKIRDIVGLYLNPPEHAVVLCLDEKSQVQALDRSSSSSWSTSIPGFLRRRGKSIWCWTITEPIRHPRWFVGLPAIRAIICTSPPRVGPGSIRSRGGLPRPPTSGFVAGRSTGCGVWKRRLRNTCCITISTRSRSYGRRMLTQSWERSKDFVNVFLTHENLHRHLGLPQRMSN
jgi:hypothetical protein